MDMKQDIWEAFSELNNKAARTAGKVAELAARVDALEKKFGIADAINEVPPVADTPHIFTQTGDTK